MKLRAIVGVCLTGAGALYVGVVCLLLPGIMTAAALGALALVALVLLGDATALWTGSLNMYIHSRDFYATRRVFRARATLRMRALFSGRRKR